MVYLFAHAPPSFNFVTPKCAESQLTTPLLPDRPHRVNTNCSWPYVCVSCLDWINFRCGVCLGLLQRGCCEAPSSSQPPPSLPLLPLVLPWSSAFPTRTHTHTQTPLLLLWTVLIYVNCVKWWNARRRNPSSPYVSLCSRFVSPGGSS